LDIYINKKKKYRRRFLLMEAGVRSV